jgi:hypothetical protein
MLLFWKTIDKTQMSKPPECAATFLKNFRSIYVSHLGLQSVTYRVDTPCKYMTKYMLSIVIE